MYRVRQSHRRARREGQELASRWRRRVAGACLLALLVAASLVRLTALYADATHSHVEVHFRSEGFETGSPLIGVDVNCVPVETFNALPPYDVLDLGWIRSGDLITVQVRVGANSKHLRFWLVVNGRRIGRSEYASPGEFGNPTGIGGPVVATWLVVRTFTSTGQIVAKDGCPPYPGRKLLLAGPRAPDTGSLSAAAFRASTWASPYLFAIYFILGVACLIALAVYRAFLAAPKTKIVWLLLGGVVGAAVAVHQIYDELQSVSLDAVIAGVMAFASGVAGIWCLGYDIISLGKAIEHVAGRLTAREDEETGVSNGAQV